MNPLELGMWFHRTLIIIRVWCITDILEVMEASPCLHHLAPQTDGGVDRNESHAVRPKGL